MDKEQARITRQQNKAIRDTARAEREAQEKADKALVLDALRAVLKDPEATAEQRVFAVATLDKMQYYGYVPYGVKYQGDASIAEFAKELEVFQRDNIK